MRLTRRSAVPLIGLGLTGAWPNSGQIYPPGKGTPVAAFDPVSLITGGGGFWRADKGVVLSGSNMSTWADQSSFANNLAANGTLPFSATGFNTSFPGLDYSSGGGADMGATFSFNSTTVSFFLLVFLQGSIADANNRLAALLASGQADFASQSTILIYGSGGGFYAFASNTNTPGVTGADVGNGGAADGITTSNPYLLGSVFDGANANIWVNGSVVGSGTAFTASIGGGASAAIALGSNASGASAHFQLAFAGLTQKAMNSSDWTNLKNWSNSNWGTSF